jgi:uncharacterized protein (TIGR02246 family)
MRCFTLILLALVLSCDQPNNPDAVTSDRADTLVLADMIRVREKAMIEKDIDTAMSQFSDDATWINSQGYFFEGKQNVLEFHGMLAGRESMDYSYEAGAPRIRLVDSSNAIAYYSWKMFWFAKGSPDNVTNEEIGLMTLTAQKREGQWYWVAVTNQHTPWFYETIDAVTVDEE